MGIESTGGRLRGRGEGGEMGKGTGEGKVEGCVGVWGGGKGVIRRWGD